MQKPVLKRLSASLLASAVLGMGGMAFVSTAAAASNPAAAIPAIVVASADTAERGQKNMHRRGHGKRGHHLRHHHIMGKAAMLIPGYGPIPKDVVDSLSLDAKQTALVDDAKSFITDHRKAQREKFSERRGDRASRTVTAPLDPHAAVKKQAERFAAMQEVRDTATEKWLAVWDALEPAQKQTLSDYVVNRSEERAKRKAEYKEKRAARKQSD